MNKGILVLFLVAAAIVFGGFLGKKGSEDRIWEQCMSTQEITIKNTTFACEFTSGEWDGHPIVLRGNP